MFHPQNILVPTDFSLESEQSFNTALNIAFLYRARVFLLHVISSAMQQSVSEYDFNKNVAERILSESIVFSNEKLQKIITENKMKNIKVIYNVRRGAPVEEILQEAAERNIDLIIIASQGKTGFKKYFIGSVAEKVTKEAKCPVLLMRSRGE